LVDGRQEIERTPVSIEIAFVAGGKAEMGAIGEGRGREGAEAVAMATASAERSLWVNNWRARL